MTYSRREALSILAASVAASSVGGSAFASETKTIVNIELWDKDGPELDAYDADTPIMLGMPGAALMAHAPMGITADKYLIPAGEVEFRVKNTSTNFEHEMIVVPIKDLVTPLPYNSDTARFDEDAAGALGEVPETEPGANGTLVLHLDPGTYLLACNIATHYAMGMWTVITIE